MTFGAQSVVTDGVRPAMAYRLDLLKPRRSASGVVVHVTGSGVWRRQNLSAFEHWRRRNGLDRESDMADVAAAVYATVMKACPHYVVGPSGRVVQTVPEELAAWHVGSSGWRAYEGVSWRQAAPWWPERWAPLASPLDMADGALWAGGSVNANTVGVELAWPHNERRDPPTEEQWRSLRELVWDVTAHMDIDLDVETVVGHADVHPSDRTRAGRPWDPPAEWWGPAVVSDWIIGPLTCRE